MVTLNTLEKVLELIKEGKRTPEEIAHELGVRREEVEAAIEILKSLGYIEEVRKGSPACETCPLKKICGGKCLVSRDSGNLRLLEFRAK